MNKELLAIFEYLEKEKGIKRDIIISAIEDSLLMAAKKSIKNADDIVVSIDKRTGDIEVYIQKTVVETVNNKNLEISLEEAIELNPDCEIGQLIEIYVPTEQFGRVAAQTARQIIAQKLREAEKDVIYEEYRDRVNELISGSVKRFIRDRTIIVDLGKVEAIMPSSQYPKTERYSIGEKVLALLLDVKDTDIGGAEVILTRSDPKFVAALFTQEVPELSEGIITIEKIVRDPGYRTKLAVSSQDPKVDPVGSLVGVRGTRIKNVIRELENEKIDVVPFSENKIELLKNAASPIQILKYKESESEISIVVNDDDYPAIIGKRGMNARLISALIEKEFTAQKLSQYQKLIIVRIAEISESDNPQLDEPIEVEGLNKLILEELKINGYTTLRKVLSASAKDLKDSIHGINYMDLLEKILEQVG